MTMECNFQRKHVEIPTNFIDYYMTSCPPVYALIYIYSMKRLLHGQSVSIDELAQNFHITQGDVIGAWKHWEKEGLVTLANGDKDGQNMSVTFLEVGLPQAKPTPEEAPAFVAKPESRPQYSIEELTHYRRESTDIARLYDKATQALGKLLTHNDLNIIFGFYDWLRLPLDVIEYLFAYCEEKGYRNIRYMEKCAIDWADNHIDDLEKAFIYVQNFDKNYRAILHYMGQSGYPTPSNRKFMDRWLDQWQMPLDIIMEACDRSVAAIDKPKFSYVDSILSAWHKKGIRDIAGIKVADAEYEAGKEKGVVPFNKGEASEKKHAPKVNRFVNFNQRNTDYSQFEKLERAYLEQRLSK